MNVGVEQRCEYLGSRGRRRKVDRNQIDRRLAKVRAATGRNQIDRRLAKVRAATERDVLRGCRVRKVAAAVHAEVEGPIEVGELFVLGKEDEVRVRLDR